MVSIVLRSEREELFRLLNNRRNICGLTVSSNTSHRLIAGVIG